ncbi:ammonium transporter [Leptolyngbya sp. Heron Island J]|uniref:ammonium transporter n=1 Tax=Leptolyngbya sp. Heron Island J TaxID=1385935 RepID=UPI0003B9EC1B|nr:ammonium transporter [Leptolyngbya sp. Heron Island J]ESA36117.1 ammonium transporter [Leptolyngbya sp. Heron Island J]
MSLSLDALWVIVSASLVFLMQAGFLCVEAGSTRRKNNINVAIKNIADVGLSILMFWAFGYGLMFGTSLHGWLGVSNFLPDFNQTDSWPIIFFLFQAMFCSTAVTIVSGAVAERMTFKGYLFSAVLISGFVYPIFGHWVWGGLDKAETIGWLTHKGFIDFAGSTIVHSLGGWVALAAVLVIGPRLGRFSRQNFDQQAPSSDLPLAFLGALLMWFGWFGFNGGSALAFNDQVPKILVNTLLAGAAGLTAPLTWSLMVQKNHLPFKAVMNGSLAGLVSITASCHAVSSSSAVLIGGIGGLVMLGVDALLDKLRIDDAVGVIPVHLGPGIWGTLAVALFSDLERLETGLDRWGQFAAQVSGVLACGLWSFTVTLLILWQLNRYVSLRVSHKQEYIGLNVSEHGARNEFQNLFETMQTHAKTGNLQRRVTASALTEIGQISRWYNQVVHALEQSTARTNAIIMTAADGILTVDPDTLILQSTNPAVEKIFGCQWLQAIGHPLTTLIETDLVQSQDAAFQSLQQFLQQGCRTGEAYMAVGIHNEGRRFPIEVLVTDSQLRATNFLTIMVRDITERQESEAALMTSELEARRTAKQLERALYDLKQAQAQLLQSEKMAGLGQLVAGIAHEINNPVGFIYGNLEHAMTYVEDLLLVISHYQAQAVELPPELQKDVENADIPYIRKDFPKLIGSITTGTERIREIVQSLKNFARFGESDVKTINIHGGLDTTLMMLAHRLNMTARRPKIVVNTHYGPVSKIECYAGAMNQVFLNLVNNAIDALETHETGIITITTEDQPQSVVITIADNGEGIPRALQQQIFDPFFTTKPVGEGTGMGLAISHQIVVEQHGGELHCHSVLGQGSKFQIVLPKTLALRSHSKTIAQLNRSTHG